MTIQLFNEEEDISLKEYSEDPNYEDYAGIVLDKEKNQFKVITGKFTDKKDFYEKMAARGLILRKCFEIRVYNWIKENAKTTLDAYLMLSTAFSKWKGNNMLSPYYNKLLKDIPELNREGQKGNPNTRGKEEAVLQEDEETISDLTYPELKVIFKDTTVSDGYLKALAIKDPITCAEALFNEYALQKPINMYEIPGSTYKNKDYYFNKEVLSDPLDKVSAEQGIDPDVAHNHSQHMKNIDSMPVYTVTLTPVLGNKKEVFGKNFGSDKLFQTYYYDLGERLPSYKTTIKEPVAIKNYGNENSLNDGLNNPVIRDAMNSLVKAMNHDLNDSNTLAGLIVNVYDTKNKNDKFADVTKNLFSNLQQNTYTDIYEKIGNNYKLLGKTLPYGQGLKDDGYFIPKNRVYAWNTSVKKMNPVTNWIEDLPQTDSEAINKIRDSIKKNYGTDYRSYEAGITHYRDHLINRLEKNNPDIVYIKDHDKQKDIIANKRAELSSSNVISGYKSFRIINGALQALNIIDSTVDADYKKNMMNVMPTNVKKMFAKLQFDQDRNEELSKVDFTNVSKKDQNATLLDKIAKIRNLKFNDKHLYGDEFGNLSIEKPTKSKKKSTYKKQDERTKEEKLENQIREINNEIKSWQYRLENARGKDRDEAINKIDSLNGFLKIAEEKLAELKSKTNTDEQKEAFVNDGATGYFLDQQAAAKDALKGTFITEEMTHSELNPALFDGEVLKPDVLDAFLEIADKFKQTLNISIDPVDVYFTGSNANYNYNENSDIDIHLVYDFEKVGIAAEILEKYLRDAKRLFNLDYNDIRVKGIKVEVGYENIATPLVATAVYSLRNNTWVKKPEMKATEIQDPDTDEYNNITNRIETAIQNKDLQALEALWKEIGELRKQSLSLEGEFGKGNALFKKLRNLGAIGRLRDAYYRAASEDLSLESKEN